MGWRDYYRRFWKEAVRDMVVFTCATVIPSVALGAFSAIAGKFFLQPGNNIVVAMEILGVGVFGMIVTRVILAFAEAPVKLDEHRVQQIAAKDSEIAGKARRIGELEQTLSAKHPHDERVERAIKDILEGLNDNEYRFVEWLLLTGSAKNGQIQTAGFHGVPELLITKAAELLTYDSYPPETVWLKWIAFTGLIQI